MLNLHGTGTALGDPIEISAALKAFVDPNRQGAWWEPGFPLVITIPR